MDNLKLDEAIERICKMEKCFDYLLMAEQCGLESICQNSAFISSLSSLIHYYENGEWLSDYALDENGLLPLGLKRGVLSQDAVFNLLERLDYMKINKYTEDKEIEY